MIPRSFQYFVPHSVEEATAILRKYGPEAKVLAGGMSLIPVMKLQLASPQYLVDINRIEGLSYIREEEGRLLIGALARHHDIETSDIVKRRVGILAETASWIGDSQVRNVGTIGGSLSHCDPSGDWGAVLLAVRGEVDVQGQGTRRTVGIDEFIVDTFSTALQPDELLTEVSVPVLTARSGGAYMKLERKAGDFAVVGVAAQLSLDEEGVCTYAGIGLSALGPKNLRAKKAEGMMVGKMLNEKIIEEVAEIVSEESRPTDDPFRGSAEYKKKMARVYAMKAISAAVGRAKGRGI